MARLPNMTNRDEVPAELREAYDRVAELRGGSVSGPYGVLLHSPEAAIRGAALSNYLRWNSAPSAVQRETAILALARHLDARVMWAGHVRIGREAGVREGLIEAIETGVDASELPAEEGEIVRYVRELFETNRVSDATFDALHARLGDQGIVDLTALLGYYAFVGATLNAFEIEPGG